MNWGGEPNWPNKLDQYTNMAGRDFCVVVVSVFAWTDQILICKFTVWKPNWTLSFPAPPYSGGKECFAKNELY